MLHETEDTPLQFEKQTPLHVYASPMDTEFQDLLHQILFEPNGDQKRMIQRAKLKEYENPEKDDSARSSNESTPTNAKSSKNPAPEEAGLDYKELRKLRNRQAAARSRQRVQQKLRDLEKLADDLQRRNRHLENLVHALAAEKCGVANGLPQIKAEEMVPPSHSWQPYAGYPNGAHEAPMHSYPVSDASPEDPFTVMFNCSSEYTHS